MSANAIIQLADDWEWKTGDGDLLGGSLTLTEGKEASSLSWQLADPDGRRRNDLPLVVIEDVPSQAATVDLTVWARLGSAFRAEVPAGTVFETDATEQFVAGTVPSDIERIRFRTDEALGPDDFADQSIEDAARGQATVSATAVQTGPGHNVEAESLYPKDKGVLPGIYRATNLEPATGGRGSGETGAKVPVDCWLGPADTSTPPKLFSGYLSQLTPSGAPGRVGLMAVDKSAEMRRKQRARSFNATNVDEVVRRLARAADFDVDFSQAELDDIQLTRHVQHGESNWQFINRLLSSVGHRVKVRGETVYVTRVGQVREEPETPVLTPGRCSSYQFAIDELTEETTPNVTALSGVQASEYGDGTDARIRATQLERIGVSSEYASAPSSIDQQEAKQLQSKAREHRVFGASIEALQLYPRLDTDDMVILEGWGRRYDGPWWIDSLTHSFAGTTSFQLTTDTDGE